VQIVVDETNRYADQYLEEHPEKADDSYVGRWTAVTVQEMKLFFGLLILTGMVRKGSLSSYWSIEELISTPLFSKVMTRDRFLLIMRFLHFNNNDDYNPDDEDRDRLHKIRPFLDMARDRFRKVYQPGKNLSVDESLILFKGRLKFKQYIKTKRARFGIKLYELTTSCGITLDMLVYPGKGMFSDEDPGTDMPSTERIPSVLMAPFLGKGHVLFTDNYNTSPSLASHLLDNHTHLCGTIKSNRRYFPKEIVNLPIDRSEAIFFEAENDRAMLACKYRAHKDKANKKPKIVHMLSTCHQTNMVDTGKTDADGIAVRKPDLIKEYNLHMGGVDRVDQQLHNVSPIRKVYKWYKKLAFRILMQMILNAQKIFVFHTGERLTFRKFLKKVIVSWITTERELPPNLVNDETVTRLTGRHFPGLLKPQEGAKDQRPSKRCRVCYKRGIRTDKGIALKTRYICLNCPSFPALHPDTCFQLYHTKENFGDLD